MLHLASMPFFPLLYIYVYENPKDGGAWWAAVHGVARSRTRQSNSTSTFHFHALEKEMATHSSILAWRIPGTGETGGLPSLGSHRVGHDWSCLAAAAAAAAYIYAIKLHTIDIHPLLCLECHCPLFLLSIYICYKTAHNRYPSSSLPRMSLSVIFAHLAGELTWASHSAFQQGHRPLL